MLETWGACFGCRWPPFGFLWSRLVLYHRVVLLRNDNLAFVEAVDDASELVHWSLLPSFFVLLW